MTTPTVSLSSLSKGGGTYGIAASAADFSPSLPTYLRISDINDDGTLDFAGLKSVDDPRSDRYKLKPDDIVFARTGASTGRNYFYDGTDGELVYAGFLIKFSIDPSKVNPLFIKYYCRSQQYNDWVNSFNSGSTRGNINAQTLSNMPIPALPREQQDLIAETLSSIDAKIALNKQINHHLEQLAQAIFKSWFIDFGPYLDGPFTPSEMGEIPAGWRAGTLSELVTVKYGKDHKKLADGSIPVFGSGGLMRFAETALYEKESVLIPRKGTLNNVMYVNRPFWTVDTMFFTEMKQPGIAKFVYLFVNSHDLASMNAGSAVPSMTTDILNRLPVVIPPDSELANFEAVAAALFDQIDANSEEITRLAEVRDSLLPRLMSGEISVAESGG
jgi:type I restriction enzyme, S subunit